MTPKRKRDCGKDTRLIKSHLRRGISHFMFPTSLLPTAPWSEHRCLVRRPWLTTLGACEDAQVQVVKDFGKTRSVGRWWQRNRQETYKPSSKRQHRSLPKIFLSASGGIVLLIWVSPPLCVTCLPFTEQSPLDKVPVKLRPTCPKRHQASWTRL